MSSRGRIQSRLAVLLFLATTGNSAHADEPPSGPAPVTAPPVSLGLGPFYTKYVSAHGLPVVGSAKVSDFALREAAYLVDQMLGHRPDGVDTDRLQ